METVRSLRKWLSEKTDRERRKARCIESGGMVAWYEVDALVSWRYANFRMPPFQDCGDVTAMSRVGREEREQVHADAGDEEGPPDADERQERKWPRPQQAYRFGQEAKNKQGPGDLPPVDMVRAFGHGCPLHILVFASVPTL
jgi:hypothetical protein